MRITHHETEPMSAADCGHNTSGRAIDQSGATLCYRCADERTRAEVLASAIGDRVTLYVNTDGTSITTWSGGTVMPRVVWGRPHPWSRERSYLAARDTAGRWWSGTGADGMWTNLRLTKQVDR